jgi:hypothetical protein
MSRAVEHRADDEPAHDKLVLLARLATVNRQILIYVTQSLDADARRVAPPNPADVHDLGTELRALGAALQAHAAEAAAHGVSR